MEYLLYRNSQIAIIIIFLLIFRAILNKKVSKNLMVTIWLMLLIRLLIPVKIIDFSLSTSHYGVKPSISLFKSLDYGLLIESNMFHIIAFSISIILILVFTVIYLVNTIKTITYSNVINEDIDRIVLENGLQLHKFEILKTTTKSPYVFGILKSKLILPLNELQDMDYLTKSFIIVHELTHLRKKHLFIKAFGILILCIYWYNPFIWLLLNKLSEDIEMVCDEEVMKRFGESFKNNYIECLTTIGGFDNSLSKYSIKAFTMKYRITRIELLKLRNMRINPFFHSVVAILLLLTYVNFEVVDVDIVDIQEKGAFDVSSFNNINYGSSKKQYYCLPLEYAISNGKGNENITQLNAATIYTDNHFPWDLDGNSGVNIKIIFKAKEFEQWYEFGFIFKNKYYVVEESIINRDNTVKEITLPISKAGDYYFVLVNFSSDPIFVDYIEIIE